MNQFKPFTADRRSSLEERQLALHQMYRQVLGRQPYDFERQILAKAEKDFLKDKIGVRRFLKELGHSEVYQKAFYHCYSNVKFIELCFKHFLGRAPRDQSEFQLYCEILSKEGVDKLITAFLDSEEYRKVFGCFTVPYTQSQSCYESPKAYLETRLLNQEHIGQRGKSVPTMYWRQLGLNCDSGVCRHPEADELLEPLGSNEAEILQVKLQELLKLLESDRAKQALAELPAQQLEKLRQVIA